MGGSMTYLKEEDVDGFIDYMAQRVGQSFFAHDDFTVDKTEIEEYETQAEAEENGREDLYTMLSVNFAMTSTNYDEDGWISVSRGCIRNFYEEDFEEFYGENE